MPRAHAIPTQGVCDAHQQRDAPGQPEDAGNREIEFADQHRQAEPKSDQAKSRERL